MKSYKFLILIVAALLFTSASYAQNGQYRVWLKTECVDLAENKLYMQILIKAYTNTTNFNVADQNYRFIYNENVLENPSIIHGVGLTGLQIDPNENYSFYEEPTLKGSDDGLISFNVEFAGGTAYEITKSKWVLVGKVAFDVIDIDGSLDLKWHKATHAPSTIVVEQLPSGGFQEAQGKKYFINTKCFDNYIGSEKRTLNQSLENSNSLQLAFSPNPFKNIANLYVEAKETQAAIINVYDINGALMYEQIKTVQAGTNNLSLDLNHLSKGLYLLSITQADKREVIKIEKF